MKALAVVAFIPLLSLQAYFVAHIPKEKFALRNPPSQEQGVFDDVLDVTG
jgi:hypothetical protein